jgi:hypothetical protein
MNGQHAHGDLRQPDANGAQTTSRPISVSKDTVGVNSDQVLLSFR